MYQIGSGRKPGSTSALTAVVTALATSMLLAGASPAEAGSSRIGSSGHQTLRDVPIGGFAGLIGAHPTLAAVRRDATNGLDIRAVLADPTIRQFIGPSDYAWDFNSPYGVPGFAPLPSTAWREPPRQLTADEIALLPSGPPAWISTSIR
jgi:hypothetical protein